MTVDPLCFLMTMSRNGLIILLVGAVQVMTASSVPSTLVKCLYLFFDLPEEGAGEAVASADSPPDNDNEFTPRERRILLQKMFMQVHLPTRYFTLKELSSEMDLAFGNMYG
jgi:hypothetical protein